ncbi:MAG TPA: hypothetical protein VM936_04340 [Pyrinomonadaceae bacterium]|jgi:hypothetical protein|nr:hypothetical protein [Pyrinomonadaceae bacterium]
MSELKKVSATGRVAAKPDGAHALFSMFASSPLLFSLLFLFLLVLAIPVKIFSPRTRIFR